MANDFLSSIRIYAQSLSNGEKSAGEVSAALNHWVKESGEALKEKIESEIESAAIRMGFVRKSDLDSLLLRIEELEKNCSPAKKTARRSPKKVAKSSSTKNSTAKMRVEK